jgi:pantetheine-phosphate adenylyltransferase
MKALYIGSFDPFTNGHYEVLKQAEELFDEVIICIARNPKKKRRFTELTCGNALNFMDGKKRTVVQSDDLTVNIMKQYGCKYLIRGLRNTSDYLYEEQLFQMNKEMDKDFKVVYLRGNNISSTFVYELYRRDMNIQPYIPYAKSHLREAE